MPNKIVLGNLYNLDLTAKPLAFISFVAVWIILSAIAFVVLRFSFLDSLIGGFVCTVLHYLSELIHHFGHAGAARNTGYPMRGVKFVHVLAYSQYPRDEPELSGKIHIRRALGGPAISFVVSVIAFLILLIAQNYGGLFYWIALWFFLDNFFVFFLGAFLPLGFTDGSSIYKWWGKP